MEHLGNRIGTAAVTENMLKRKWSTVVLRYLADGVSDPADICARESDLSRQALNERLRTMMRYNLISRRPIGNGGGELAKYTLTLRGQKLLKMLTAIELLDQLQDVVIQESSAGGIILSAQTNRLSPGALPSVSKWRSKKKLAS